MSQQTDTDTSGGVGCCACGSRLELCRLKVMSSAACERFACDACFPMLLFWQGFMLGYVVNGITVHCSPIVLCDDMPSKNTFLDPHDSTPVNTNRRTHFAPQTHNHIDLPSKFRTKAPVQNRGDSYDPTSDVTNRGRCRLKTFQDGNKVEDETRQLQSLPLFSDDDEAVLPSKSKQQARGFSSHVHMNCQIPNLLVDVETDVNTELQELITDRSMFTPSPTVLKPKPSDEAKTVKPFSTHVAKKLCDDDVKSGIDKGIAGISTTARLRDSRNSRPAKRLAHVDSLSAPAENKREKCRFCERWIAKKFLDRHIHYKHRDKSTSTSIKLEKCMHCEAMLNVQNKGNLRRHLLVYHPAEYRSSWKLARVQCKQCHRMVSKCSFSHHMQVNHPSASSGPCTCSSSPNPQDQSDCSVTVTQTHPKKDTVKSNVNDGGVATKPNSHKQFKQEQGLKAPPPKHHNEDGVQDSGSRLKKSKTCLKCGEKFDGEAEFRLHMSEQHQHQMFTCKLCGRQYPTQTGLSGHMQSAHNTPNVLECQLCGETFSTFRRTYDLERHKVQVHKLKEHVCHICGKKFSMKKNLKFHLEAHDGVPRYFCEICGKGFLRPSTLHAHKKVHGPKASKGSGRGGSRKGESCAVCMAAKVTSVQCSLHGPRKLQDFVCQVCGKDFSSSSGLHAHARQHKAPRFSCEICGKEFTYKCNWKHHLELHAGKTFPCNSCAKTFPTERHLLSHKKKHSKAISIVCPLCGKGLKKKSGLYTHIRTMHPEAATNDGNN